MKGGAGALDRRLHFEERTSVDDGYGNTEGAWLRRFTVWGKRTWLRGGEAVLAARLESRQPAVLTVRVNSQTRGITSDWRAIDDETGQVFNLRENPKLSENRAYFDMLAESGVAV